MGTPRLGWLAEASGIKTYPYHGNNALQRNALAGSGTDNGLRSGSIRQKIIGRSIAAFGRRLSGWHGFAAVRRPLALLHQPAGEHGSGIFLHPLIDKGRNLLAKICGMTETRQFIALQ
jgi:hypothetical protein